MKALKAFGWFLMFLLMLAAVGGGGYAIWLERQDRAEIAQLKKTVEGFDPRFAKFKAAMGEVSKGLTSMVLEETDLTKAGWQPIGKGFYLVDVAASPQDGGVKIRGKIINATAIIHENLVFAVRMAKSTGTITIARAAPAVALPFEVTVPGVPAAEGKRAIIELQSSTISFASTTGKSPPARETFDPEKLLKGAN
jgi:hypothetical protein